MNVGLHAVTMIMTTSDYSHLWANMEKRKTLFTLGTYVQSSSGNHSIS
jgi:hypothetical protein